MVYTRSLQNAKLAAIHFPYLLVWDVHFGNFYTLNIRQRNLPSSFVIVKKNTAKFLLVQNVFHEVHSKIFCYC